MNGQQRRRLKRIRQRQAISAAKKLSQGDQQFIKAHCPHPSRVCVMSPDESQRFHDVSIGHRCTSTAHRHYTRHYVEILLAHGCVEWVGGHFKIARWTESRTWQGVDSGGTKVMQLVRGLR